MERTNAASRGLDGRATPKEERERIPSSTPQPAVFRYRRKIKEAFDPKDLGDSCYLILEEPGEEPGKADRGPLISREGRTPSKANELRKGGR